MFSLLKLCVMYLGGINSWLLLDIFGGSLKEKSLLDQLLLYRSNCRISNSINKEKDITTLPFDWQAKCGKKPFEKCVELQKGNCFWYTSVIDICNWAVSSSFTAVWNWMKQMKQGEWLVWLFFIQMCFQPLSTCSWKCKASMCFELVTVNRCSPGKGGGGEVNPEYLPTISAWWASVSC